MNNYLEREDEKEMRGAEGGARRKKLRKDNDDEEDDEDEEEDDEELDLFAAEGDEEDEAEPETTEAGAFFRPPNSRLDEEDGRDMAPGMPAGSDEEEDEEDEEEGGLGLKREALGSEDEEDEEEDDEEEEAEGKARQLLDSDDEDAPEDGACKGGVRRAAALSGPTLTAVTSIAQSHMPLGGTFFADTNLSRFERKQRALQKQISALEEYNVSQRPWQLSGGRCALPRPCCPCASVRAPLTLPFLISHTPTKETHSKKRPENSLLQEDLDFDQTAVTGEADRARLLATNARRPLFSSLSNFFFFVPRRHSPRDYGGKDRGAGGHYQAENQGRHF